MVLIAGGMLLTAVRLRPSPRRRTARARALALATVVAVAMTACGVPRYGDGSTAEPRRRVMTRVGASLILKLATA